MEPRYANVARLLVEAIASGHHPVGSILPNELDLAEQFGVSRSTMRAAMRELQASGLISRRRSAGTRVEALTPPRSGIGFTQALSSIEAVQQFGIESERSVQTVADIVADDDLSLALGCRPGRKWLHISSLRLVPGDASRTPICWTDVYIDSVFAPEVRSRLDGYRGIFGTLLEEISGRKVTEIRQEIRAIGVPKQLSGPLKAKADTHALEIRRQYVFSAGEIAEVSLSVHPADRFIYTTRLTRQDGSDG